MTLNELIAFTERRLKHAKARYLQIEKEHGPNPGATHTYHGGVEIGMWQARVGVYQDMLDELKELEK